MTTFAILDERLVGSNIMATMNISLNDTQRDYVQERLASGGFSNASDSIVDSSHCVQTP
jgi:hypothetical protein